MEDVFPLFGRHCFLSVTHCKLQSSDLPLGEMKRRLGIGPYRDDVIIRGQGETGT
jgi:hypothetical protein